MTNATTRTVRARMKRLGKNQSQLARELGISKTHMSLILSGKRFPSLRLALKLEQVTGVPVRDFANVA